MSEKQDFLEEQQQIIEQEGFRIQSSDLSRPWGGFFVIDESQISQFITKYFPQIDIKDIGISHKLSPKILVVAPEKRLSWQYHDRRAEIWRVISGTVGVKTSETDEEGKIQILESGDLIKLKQGERHRLIGLDSWGVEAEIWQHIDDKNPSDENDIYRLQDDFGR